MNRDEKRIDAAALWGGISFHFNLRSFIPPDPV
jgi:hypothetical protein